MALTLAGKVTLKARNQFFRNLVTRTTGIVACTRVTHNLLQPTGSFDCEVAKLFLSLPTVLRQKGRLEFGGHSPSQYMQGVYATLALDRT